MWRTTFHVIVAVTALTAAATGKTPDNLVDRNSSSPSHKNSSDGNVLWIARRYFAIVAVAVILALLCLALFYRRTFFKCCVGTVATPRRDRRHFHFRGSNAHIPDELSFPYLYGRFSRDGESQDPFFHASSDTVDHPVGGFRRVIVRLLSHRRVLIFAGLPLRGRLPHHQPQHNHDVVGEASASASIEEGSDEEYGHIYVAMPAEATTGVELYNVDRILLDGREGTHNNPFGSTSSSTVEDEVLEGSPELSAVGSFSLPKQDNPYGEGYYTDVHGAVVMEHSLDVEIEASAFVEKDDARR